MIVNTEIPPLSLRSWLAHLGRLQVMEPETEDLMQELNERDWRGEDRARGELWASAFHASQFPGDDPTACTRLLTYGLMGFAPEKPMPPWVTTTGDQGKAGEMSLARAWYEGGRLLATPEDLADGEQLVFGLPEHWLTGSVDLPILKPGWRKPFIVEVKGKAQEVIDEMQAGKRRWDAPHRRQLLAALGIAHKQDWGSVMVCESSWRLPRVKSDNPFLADASEPELTCREHGGDSCLIEIDLEPPDCGSLYYWSRSWPRKTVEFFFEHDPEFMERGLKVLDKAREHFLADEIPPRDPSFQWSLTPCKYCKLKSKTCKPDFIKRTHQERLSESNGVEFTRSVRPTYDPEAARSEVFTRWSEGDSIDDQVQDDAS